MASSHIPTLLRTAATAIRLRGWHQGDWHQGGRICAGAALNIVLDRAPGVPPRYGDSDWRARQECLQALCAAIPTDNLARWNDESGRTVEEVLAAFEAAAVWAEQELRDGEAVGDPGGQGEDQGPDHG